MKPAADFALARSRLYKLLAVALAAPEKGFFVALKDGFFLAALREEITSVGLGDALETTGLETVLDKADLPSRQAVIVQEYTNLFVHPGTPAQPYETEYTAAHPFMKSDQLADLMGFYRAFGLDMSETDRDRPDSIVAELEFMHVLCLKEAAARAHYFGQIEMMEDAEKRFLGDHIGRWAGPFAQKVSESGISPLYASLLLLVHEFTAAECRRLGVVPDSPPGVSTDREEPGLCETPAAPLEEPIP